MKTIIGIGMKKTDKISAINSVKVIVSPWQKGFTCGIIMDTKSKMTTEQYELCSTIARGMIKMATSDPHSTFLWGLRGFAEDKKRNDKDLTVSSIAEFDDDLFSEKLPPEAHICLAVSYTEPVSKVPFS